MTEESLRLKVQECIENNEELIQRLITKAIASGSMDITGADDNYALAKMLLSAIYKDMSRHYTPPYDTRKTNKIINNIYRQI